MFRRCPKMLLLLMVLVFMQSFNAWEVEHNFRESSPAWYQGCYHDNGDPWLQSVAITTYSSVAECASHCLVTRFWYAGIQWMDKLRCVCLNTTTALSQADTCDSRDNSVLPIGLSEGFWAIYSSMGPYLTQVAMETDSHVVMVNRPVTMEISVLRVADMNVTEGDWKTGHILNIQWWVKEGNQSYSQSAEDGNRLSVNRESAIFNQSENLAHNQSDSTNTIYDQYGNNNENVTFDQSSESTNTTYNQSAGGWNTSYNQSDIGNAKYNQSGDGRNTAYTQSGDGRNTAYNQSGDDTTAYFHQSMDMADYTDIYHQFLHTFEAVGMYTIDVRVSNEISSLVTSIDLEVVYPTPRDLQVGLHGDDDLPSCAQVAGSVERGNTQVLAVFVNTSTHLEASVTMGTNLTFTFWFEDNKEVNIVKACDECTSEKQEHIFQIAGEFTVVTTVRNSYGMAQKNITLLVLERKLSDLRIDLDPTSSAIATTEDLLVFQISMVTTSRSNLSLQVWYGDGGSNVFSVTDTNSPGLVLLGDGKTLDIVANYGNSCVLVVEFQYQYKDEGHYWPKVALMESNDVVDKLINDKSISAFTDQTREYNFPNVLESTHEIDQTFPSRGEKRKEDFVMNPLDHHMFAFGMYENSSNEEHTEDSGKSDSYILTATLPEAVMILSELTGLLLHGPRLGHCAREVEFFLQSPTRLNMTVTWIVYRIRDKQIDDDVPELETDIESINDDEAINEDEAINDDEADNEEMEDVASVIDATAYPVISGDDENKNSNSDNSIKVNEDASDDRTGDSEEDGTAYHVGIGDDKNSNSANRINVNEDDSDDRTVTGDDEEDDKEDMDVVLEVTTTSAVFKHAFTQVGVYMIIARAQNALSVGTANTNIMIQCPIEGLNATCGPEYLETGSEMICTAEVSHGSHVYFLWIIEGQETFKRLQSENHTSIIQHRIPYPGVYDITVQAFNNISGEELEVETAVMVRDAMREIKVYKVVWTLLGNITHFAALYQPAQGGVNSYCHFDFDFGNGRVNKDKLTNCDGDQCYVEEQHRFETAGKHSVKVYGYNNVSEIVEVVDIWVVRGLDDVEVEVVGVPTAGSPVRVRLVEEGNTMVTANVYFTWRFGEDRVYITNAPTVEVLYEKPGNYVATVTATKPVVSETFHVPIVIRSRTAVSTHLLHDLYVQPGREVEFTLKVKSQGPLIGWSQLLVNYSDGQSDKYSGIIYKWSHIFHDIGPQQVDVSLLDAQETTIDMLTSHLTVEQPITGLRLLGLTAVAFEEYKTNVWRASMDSGSHVLYRWTLDNSTVITTTPQYETQCPDVGEYTLQLEAFNDVTPPTTTSLPIIVQYPIGYANLYIIGNLVGMETIIQIMVDAYPDFNTRIDYGDGISAEKRFSDLDPVANITSIAETQHIVTFKHVFAEGGDYLITGNVSNNVSHVTCWKLFIPVVKMTLKTRSPWVIKTPGHVTVMATVKGGQDLMLDWNFSDDFGETSVTRYENQTSVSVHTYGMSGEYVVSLNVTGEHYPRPGLYVTLPRPITVIDPIERLRIDVEKNYAALEGNVTRSIKFDARSSGSHVRFLFDFGDGTSMEVEGNQLPFLALDMTMFAEGRHVYSEVGEYKVKVTAVNLLGNKTAEMSRSFFVQEPPRHLDFCGGRLARMSGRVGENITLCANVTMGTNVTFSWKLGDQTDIIKAGPVITHRYRSPGEKTVFVTAKNKVRSLDAKLKVHVNFAIQGVKLLPQSTVVPLGQAIRYRAVVEPDYANTQSFIWKFQCSGSRKRGGRTTFKSRQNALMYTFRQSGRCYASVYASNYLSNATSKSVEMHVIAEIQNLEILVLSDKTERLVNQPIRFEYFVYSGSDLNLTWSFGDGSEQITTTDREVEHMYHREDGYQVTLMASNAFSSETVSTLLFILDQSYCNKPSVTILNGPATKVPLSQPITLEADVKTECNLTSILAFDWRINGHRLYDYVTNKRVLVLPSHTLPYGTHNFQLKVKMLDTIVYSAVSTIVEVVASPLVSRILGGIYRQMLPNDTIFLDGSASYDPDFPYSSNFSYSWTCHFKHKDGSHGDVCFRGDSMYNSTCNVAMTTDQLTIPGYCVVTAANYTFELTVYAPGRRNGTSFQLIDVAAETKLLRVSIVQPHAPAGPVNPDRKLTFQATCDSCPSSEDLRYEWSLYHLHDVDIWNLARAHDLICVEPYGGSYETLKLAEEDDKRKTAELENQENITQLSDSSQRETTIEQDLIDTTEGIEDSMVTEAVNDDYDQVTRFPLPWDGQIKEGDPTRGLFRKRRDLDDSDDPLDRNRRGLDKKEEPLERKRRGLDDSDDPLDRNRRGLDKKEEPLERKRRGLEDREGPPDRKRPGDGPSDTTPSYTDDWGSARIPQISENIDQVSSRRLGHSNNLPVGMGDITEGDPGDSGSSGGRQFGGTDFPGINVTESTNDGRGNSGQVLQGSGSVNKTVNKWEWETRQPDETRKLTILDHRHVPVYLQEDQTRTGLTGESLVIKPGVLQQGLTYILQLTVHTQDGVQEGQAKSQFTVNASPVYGRCTVKPDSGLELHTEFSVHCIEWKDQMKHEPLMYQVRYGMNKSTSHTRLLYRGVNNKVTFTLPAGHPEQKFKGLSLCQ